jgi:transcriptional regulator GlxA family with amidase domain
MKLMGGSSRVDAIRGARRASNRKVYFAFANNGIVGTDIVRAKNDMGAIGRPVEIGILVYPQAQLAAVHGLTDIFLVANRFAAVWRVPAEPALRISHWRQIASGKAVECVFDTSPGPDNRPAVLIAPPSLSNPISHELAAPFAAWLAERHDDGSVLCSVCAGAFVLAETGLLAGRSATTHWSHVDELTQRFPDIRVDGDKLIIEDGDMITAGGVMAWTDLGMKLVDRLLGSTIMLETARFLLIDPPGREQRYYSSFSPNFHHGDRPILNVQHWLQSNGAKDTSLRDMAARAGLEERTFLRRFQKATGLRPTEYCQQLRIGRAREMLEYTNHAIDQIAFNIGYKDSGAFRGVFHKFMGISPSAYRKRFGLTAARVPGMS